MSLRRRVTRLDGGAGPVDPKDCDGGPTLLVAAGEPFDAGAAPACPKCGAPHILVIDEVVVRPPGTGPEES